MEPPADFSFLMKYGQQPRMGREYTCIHTLPPDNMPKRVFIRILGIDTPNGLPLIHYQIKQHSNEDWHGEYGADNGVVYQRIYDQGRMYTIPDYEARDTPWFDPEEASNILPGSMELILTEEEDTERKETRNRVLQSSSRNMPTEWPTSLFASNEASRRPDPRGKPKWVRNPTDWSEIGPDGFAIVGKKGIDGALYGLKRNLSTGGSKRKKYKRRNSKRRNSKRRNSKRRNSKRRNSKRKNSKRKNSKRRNSKRRNSLNM